MRKIPKTRNTFFRTTLRQGGQVFASLGFDFDFTGENAVWLWAPNYSKIERTFPFWDFLRSLFLTHSLLQKFRNQTVLFIPQCPMLIHFLPCSFSSSHLKHRGGWLLVPASNFGLPPAIDSFLSMQFRSSLMFRTAVTYWAENLLRSPLLLQLQMLAALISCVSLPLTVFSFFEQIFGFVLSNGSFVNFFLNHSSSSF